MTSRLFVGIRPPLDGVDALDVFVQPRRDSVPEWSWPPAANWHVTLAFLGEVTDEAAAELSDRLDKVAARNETFDLRVGGAGAFPRPDAAKVLWLAARPVDPDRTEALDRLAAAVRTACQRTGLRPDSTRFTGHVTLARSRRPVEATRYLRVLDALPPLTWRTAEIDLIESVLNRGGSIYRTRARFPLAGSPPERHAR